MNSNNQFYIPFDESSATARVNTCGFNLGNFIFYSCWINIHTSKQLLSYLTQFYAIFVITTSSLFVLTHLRLMDYAPF